MRGIDSVLLVLLERLLHCRTEVLESLTVGVFVESLTVRFSRSTHSSMLTTTTQKRAFALNAPHSKTDAKGSSESF